MMCFFLLRFELFEPSMHVFFKGTVVLKKPNVNPFMQHASSEILDIQRYLLFETVFFS